MIDLGPFLLIRFSGSPSSSCCGRPGESLGGGEEPKPAMPDPPYLPYNLWYERLPNGDTPPRKSRVDHRKGCHDVPLRVLSTLRRPTDSRRSWVRARSASLEQQASAVHARRFVVGSAVRCGPAGAGEAGDVSEMLASVLVKDPDISGIGAEVPARIRSVVRRCLVKDPKDRLRDVVTFHGIANPVTVNFVNKISSFLRLSSPLSTGRSYGSRAEYGELRTIRFVTTRSLRVSGRSGQSVLNGGLRQWCQSPIAKRTSRWCAVSSRILIPSASALDPNICNIHEINETDDGQLYLVMALPLRTGKSRQKHPVNIGPNGAVFEGPGPLRTYNRRLPKNGPHVWHSTRAVCDRLAARPGWHGRRLQSP